VSELAGHEMVLTGEQMMILWLLVTAVLVGQVRLQPGVYISVQK
jgi:hypothetical protein